MNVLFLIINKTCLQPTEQIISSRFHELRKHLGKLLGLPSIFKEFPHLA